MMWSHTRAAANRCLLEQKLAHRLEARRATVCPKPACSNRLPFRLVPAAETCHKFSIAMKAIRDSDGRFGLRRQAQRDSAFRGGLRRGPVNAPARFKGRPLVAVESLQSAPSGQPRLIP